MSLQIVSGGQTGVDRAALDAAICLEIPHGGWCPRGRLAEDGAIPDKYELKETSSKDYAVRTEKNVVESDGTLILFRSRLKGGTRLTHRLTKRHVRPCLLVDLDTHIHEGLFLDWMAEIEINVLNVAGPRESSHPGIYQLAFDLLKHWLEQLQVARKTD